MYFTILPRANLGSVCVLLLAESIVLDYATKWGWRGIISRTRCFTQRVRLFYEESERLAKLGALAGGHISFEYHPPGRDAFCFSLYLLRESSYRLHRSCMYQRELHSKSSPLKQAS